MPDFLLPPLSNGDPDDLPVIIGTPLLTEGSLHEHLAEILEAAEMFALTALSGGRDA